MKPARSATIGAEIDGSTLTLVRVEESTVVYYERFSHLGGLATAAMIRQLATLPGRDRVVISWASPGTATRRVSTHELATLEAEATIDEIVNRHIPAGSQLPGAGLVHAGENASHPSAMVAAITSESALVLLHELGDAACNLMVAPFTLTHDGLYLAIRESCCELTLVREGIPISTRQLTGGGLSKWTEVDSLPLSNESLSTKNAETLRRYLANISREVHRTIELWESNGDSCPRTVWVFGAGASLPHLPAVLRNVGITVAPAPVGNNLDVGIIPRDECLAAYGALAAATLQTRRPSFVATSRRTGSTLRKRRTPRAASTQTKLSDDRLTRKGKRGFSAPLSGTSATSMPRGTGVAILAAAVVILVAAYSWTWSGRRIDDAQRSVAVANRELQSSQDEERLADVKRSAVRELDKFAEFVPPAWVSAMTTLFRSLPSEPRVTSMTFTATDGSVQARFSAEIPSDKMREWEIALASSGAAISIVQTDNSAEGVKEFFLKFAEKNAASIGSGS